MHCLEKVQLHQVIVVLLNISAAIKHKVFCIFSCFKHETESSEQRRGSICSSLCYFSTHRDQGCLFFPFLFSTLRIIHLLLDRGLNRQYALKSADFSCWHIVTSRLAELHISIWQQQAAQLFKSPAMFETQTLKSSRFHALSSCYVTVSSQRSWNKGQWWGHIVLADPKIPCLGLI